MPDMVNVCRWLEQTPVGARMRGSLWLFPVVETAHLLGMAAFLATVASLDLRLMGCAMRRQRISRLAQRLFPWIWGGFAVQVVTGALLFCSEAVKIYNNPAFRLKMLLIFLSGVHALIFQLVIYPKVAVWNDSTTLPMRVKLAGGVSILLWIGVVAAGRFIGFV